MAKPISVKYGNVDSNDLLQSCMRSGNSISEIVFENEKSWRSDADTRAGLRKIWSVMEKITFSMAVMPMAYFLEVYT